MKLNKLQEIQTHDKYEIQFSLEEDGTIYGNLNCRYIQSHTGNYCSRVKLFFFGRLLEDTLDQEGKELKLLIQEVLKRNRIEIDD